jgi:hypothetical protein
MAIPLREDTASQEIPLGHFVDDADGVTAMTALTIANTDIKLWKSGATTLANKNSGGATHISGGIYYAVLDATDTDTAGPLIAFVNVAGALPVRVECVVLPAATYDAQITGEEPYVYGQVSNSNTPTTDPTTTTFETDTTAIVAKADDFYNSSYVVFTTGNLKGMRFSITDWNTTTNVLTVDTMPEAPANDDKFYIIG